MTLKVVLVYPHLPHYRREIFDLLDRDATLDLTFVADDSSRDGSILTIPGHDFNNFHVVHNRWFGRFLWQKGLLSFLLRSHADVVIFLGDVSFLSTWLGAAITRLRGSRVLFWTIGWHRPERGLRRASRLLFYTLAHRLLLYGDVARSLGEKMGYPERKMAVIYNSSSAAATLPEAPSEDLADLRRSLPSGERPIATAVIRLNPVKRLDLLVQAAGVLLERGFPVDIVLAGRGPELEALQALAQSLGVRLYTPGPVYEESALQLIYNLTDVTVVPSVAGLTVLQSLRYGKPVITHDNIYEQAPESEAIIPGRTGDYYRHEDLDSLASVMERWLTRTTDQKQMTARECRESIRDRWSAPAQHRLILAEIQRTTRKG